MNDNNIDHNDSLLKLHDLRPAPGSKTARTRVGRGEASKGKTAGRGTKGTKARNQVPFGFEGGQIPLHMRLPKLRGFNNPFRVEFQVVNLRSEEHTSELQSRGHLVCRLLLEKKKKPLRSKQHHRATTPSIPSVHICRVL